MDPLVPWRIELEYHVFRLPFYIGKDARNLEQLLDEVYVYKSNYKLQNLALWVPLATIEFSWLAYPLQIPSKGISQGLPALVRRDRAFPALSPHVVAIEKTESGASPVLRVVLLVNSINLSIQPRIRSCSLICFWHSSRR